MTSYDVAALIQSAAAALRAGDRPAARALLLQALRLDPDNEHATLWLSGVLDTPAEQRACLQRVLELNPRNEVARRGLAHLNGPQSDAMAAAAPEPAGAPAESAAPDPLAATQPPAAPADAPWAPPTPLPAEVVANMAASCHSCGAQVYGSAAFCWHCHAPVHVCANCIFAPEPRCKEAQRITDLVARNVCPWWRPE